MGRPEASGIYRDACTALALAPGGADEVYLLRSRWHRLRAEGALEYPSSSSSIGLARIARDPSAPLPRRLAALAEMSFDRFPEDDDATAREEALRRDPSNPAMQFMASIARFARATSELELAVSQRRYDADSRRVDAADGNDPPSAPEERLRLAIADYESSWISARSAWPAFVAMDKEEELGGALPLAGLFTEAEFPPPIMASLEEARQVLATGRSPRDETVGRAFEDAMCVDLVASSRALDHAQLGPVESLQKTTLVLECLAERDPRAAIEFIASALPSRAQLRDSWAHSAFLKEFDRRVLDCARSALKGWTRSFWLTRERGRWRVIFRELAGQWIGQSRHVFGTAFWGIDWSMATTAIEVLGELKLEEFLVRLRERLRGCARSRLNLCSLPPEIGAMTPGEFLQTVAAGGDLAARLLKALIRRDDRYIFLAPNCFPEIPAEFANRSDLPLELHLVRVRQPGAAEEAVRRAHASADGGGCVRGEMGRVWDTEFAALLLLLRDHPVEPVAWAGVDPLIARLEDDRVDWGEIDLRPGMLSALLELSIRAGAEDEGVGQGLLARMDRLRALIERWAPDDGLARIRMKHAFFAAWLRREIDVVPRGRHCAEAERFARSLADFPERLAAEIEEYSHLRRLPVAIRAELLIALASTRPSSTIEEVVDRPCSTELVRRVLELGVPDGDRRIGAIAPTASFLARRQSVSSDSVAAFHGLVWDELREVRPDSIDPHPRRRGWFETDGGSGVALDRDLRAREYQELLEVWSEALFDRVVLLGDLDAVAAALWERSLAADIPRRFGRPFAGYEGSAAIRRLPFDLHTFLMRRRPSVEECIGLRESIAERAALAEAPSVGGIAIDALSHCIMYSPRIDGKPEFLAHLDTTEIARLEAAYRVGLGPAAKEACHVEWRSPFYADAFRGSIDQSADIEPGEDGPENDSQDES